MNKTEFRSCVQKEIYEYPHCSITNKYLRRIYLKYFNVNTHVVFIIRKMMYFSSKNSWFYRIKAKRLHIWLQKAVSVYINPYATIGEGLILEHPFNIVVGEAVIGKNCTLLHNVTIGSKKIGDSQLFSKPVIGDNFIGYANSMVLGPIMVCDNVRLGSFSLINRDINEPGTYVGVPAKKMS
jgi:serine acetyltransferase